MKELLGKLAELEISLEARGTELDIYDPHQELTQALLSVIKENKPEILALLKDVSFENNTLSISKTEEKEHYTLSYIQKRLYFLYEFDRTSIAYNMPKVALLEGDLDLDRLDGAFNHLLLRHESLRTIFSLVNEIPVQKILQKVRFTSEYVESDKESVETVIRKFIRPFDLQCAPILRIGLVRIENNTHILILDMHHIIADGISQEILIKDFLAFYNNVKLPVLKLQFRDYAEWQQDAKRSGAIGEQKNFWLQNFQEEIVPLDLPADFPRPSIIRYEGATLDFAINAKQTAQLQTIAESQGATMFMVMLSIYNILLCKLSGQEDIVIGTPVAGRHHDDLQNVIGVFMNTLPLRNYPKSQMTFSEFLADVKFRTLRCIDNQDYQYEQLIDELKIHRDASRNPLFDVLFDFANYDQSTIEIPGLVIKPYAVSHQVAKFDLTLSAHLVKDEMQLTFEYSTNLFKKETINGFINYFNNIVATVIRDPGLTIGDIEILTAHERERLFTGFNNTKAEYPKYDTIISLFEKQVSGNPDKIAIVYENRSLTYRELNELSNRLAHYLRKQNKIEPEGLVALMTERSDLMVIGLLGILKSGGAYVPIDPTYPRERIEYILEDSGARVLLTNDKIRGAITYSGDTVCLENIKGDDASNPHRVNTPDDLCYLIYTSGSPL